MALKCGAMGPKCGRRRPRAGSGQGSVGCGGVDSRGANQKVSPREGSTWWPLQERTSPGGRGAEAPGKATQSALSISVGGGAENTPSLTEPWWQELLCMWPFVKLHTWCVHLTLFTAGMLYLKKIRWIGQKRREAQQKSTSVCWWQVLKSPPRLACCGGASVGGRGASVDRPAGPEGNSDTGQQGDCAREHVLVFHATHENSVKGDAWPWAAYVTFKPQLLHMQNRLQNSPAHSPNTSHYDN